MNATFVPCLAAEVRPAPQQKSYARHSITTAQRQRQAILRRIQAGTLSPYMAPSLPIGSSQTRTAPQLVHHTTTHSRAAPRLSDDAKSLRLMLRAAEAASRVDAAAASVRV